MKNAKTQTVQLLLAVFLLSPLTARGDKQPTIKITDSRLHSINYGVDSLQHWVNKVRKGDAARAASLTRDLEKLEIRFSRIPVTDSEQYEYVSKRMAELRNAILQKPDEQKVKSSMAASHVPAQAAGRPHPGILNIANMLNSLEQDVPRYQDNHKQRSRMRSDLTTLKQRFDRLPASKHPDYLATQKRLGEVAAALQTTKEPLALSQQQVAEYLEGIKLKYSQKIRLPEVRDIMTQRELTAADVDGILARMKTFAEHADKDLPQLRRVVEATGSGAYWLKWLEESSANQLKRNMRSIKVAIDKRINSGLQNAMQRSSLDPQKNRYAFSNESVRKQHEADHARTLRTIQQATRLEEQLGMPTTWSPKLAEMEALLSTYQDKAKSASEVRELPADVGTQQEHTVAKEVLRNKKYGVGKIVRLIVNSKSVPRDRVEHKPFNGSIETIVRKWEQFQVTTVEEENGKLTVYVKRIWPDFHGPQTPHRLTSGS